MAFPTYYLKTVLDILPEWVIGQGKKAILLDLDNTILPRDTNLVSPDIFEWVQRIKAAGIEVCLVSNNWHERVQTVADQLGCRLVDKAIKPLPPAFVLGLWRCRCWPWQAIVVGDQVFTDVVGGTLLGMKTIMVLPLAAFDLKHTLLLRHLEKLVIRDRKPLESL